MIFQEGYQRTAFLNSTNRISASVYKGFHNISQYFGLRKANEMLARENAGLRQQLFGLNRQNLMADTVRSTFFPDTSFTVIEAKVISNSVNKQKNYLLIDKGKNAGVEPDMAIISPDGVVGLVVYASAEYSVVMSALHRDIKINARIKKNNHLGNMQWNGLNYRTGLLTDIPSHVSVDKGDTIVTSGNSFIFPSGLLIGTVEEYISIRGENFNQARIRFSSDFNSLTFVYVLRNKNRKAQTDTFNQVKP